MGTYIYISNFLLLVFISVIGSQALPSSSLQEPSSGFHKDTGNFSLHERVLPPDFFYDGGFRIICGTTDRVLANWRAILAGTSGHTLSADVRQPAEITFADINISAKERLLRRRLLNYQSRCRLDCRCDPTSGEIIPFNSGVRTGRGSCTLERIARTCVGIHLCACFRQLGQPQRDPDVSQEEYDDAINQIPSFIRNHPGNADWVWAGATNPQDPRPGTTAEMIESGPIEDTLNQLYAEELDMNNPEAFWESVLYANDLRQERERRRGDDIWKNSFLSHGWPGPDQKGGSGGRDGLLRRDLSGGIYTDESDAGAESPGVQFT
ncbi:hypothetical protein TWF225_006137 [Orbilia oligospora]|nr:hypothetical protein TWF225_006137 [Orbilia oligospora]KAF3247536.1 hypothetical protein TWF128_008612 [Orbilia oligospora]KAF3250833.1 hypothetical protein TWF217_008446 [Orbilia oligospora]KAF3280666.1 hypothetical protein TWF132_011489 [Orbilia oligospora]